jgi:hypothetical protein
MVRSTRTALRLSCAAALFTGTLVIFGCSNSKPDGDEGPPPPAPGPTLVGQKLAGRVTYNGKPVPYGFVLFYSPQHRGGAEGKGGQIAPTGVGAINPDGRYEIADAVVGPVIVCVATDPDVPLMSLVGPTAFGAAPSGKGGGATGPKGPDAKGGPAVGKGVPPGAKGPPDAKGGPPDAKAGPGGKAGVPMMKDQDGKTHNPMTKDLSAEQLTMLKEIHEKYGYPRKSPIHYVVHGGEIPPFNIELPWPEQKGP